MAYLIGFRASALQSLLALGQKMTLIRRFPLVGAVLATIVICRLLPASYLHGIDDLTGRPGDALLLLAVLLLVTCNLLLRLAPPSVSTSLRFGPGVAMLENHLRLDDEIDKKLNEVIDDTESSALAIIEQVRHLYDSASRLVTYLDGSALKEVDFRREIIDSVAHLVELGAFIAELPVKSERDLQSARIVAQEIKDLNGLVGAVQSLSMQSHLLALNAAIEASRAGTSGAAFRIVANEMRALAADSSALAARINEGLSRASHAVEGSLASSIAESSRQLDAVSLAGLSIQKLQDNFDDMSQYYKTRFLVVTKHNEDLAGDIAAVLGQIQYQDVVRQCIERIRLVIGRRNTLFQDAVGTSDRDGVDLRLLPGLLELIFNDFVRDEGKHTHSARDAPAGGSEPRIELF